MPRYHVISPYQVLLERKDSHALVCVRITCLRRGDVIEHGILLIIHTKGGVVVFVLGPLALRSFVFTLALGPSVDITVVDRITVLIQYNIVIEECLDKFCTTMGSLLVVCEKEHKIIDSVLLADEINPAASSIHNWSPVSYSLVTICETLVDLFFVLFLCNVVNFVLAGVGFALGEAGIAPAVTKLAPAVA